MLYAHWSQVKDWPYTHFTPKELASRGDGSLLVDHDAISRLEAMREIIGRPMVINSAYRDPLHNARVGGSPMSMHKQGRAFDISLRGHIKRELIDAAKAVGFTGLGVRYKTFIHVDTGRVRTW